MNEEINSVLGQLLTLSLNDRILVIERILLTIPSKEQLSMSEIIGKVINQSSPFIGQQKALPGIVYRSVTNYKQNAK